MKSNSLWHVLRIAVVLVLAVGTCALAQDPPPPVHLSGIINDYTPATVPPALSPAGPWEIRGVWSLNLQGESGTADFSAALTMERSDEGVTQTFGDFNNPKVSRHAHTHHITLVGGTVMPIVNGFRVTGPATITGNGNFPPPDFGPNTTLQIDITGGNAVTFSNIAVTFIGDAASHFGTQPFHGVVRKSK